MCINSDTQTHDTKDGWGRTGGTNRHRRTNHTTPRQRLYQILLWVLINKREEVEKMEEKNINDILKQIDTENAYNEVETLENYFYSNYIVEY